MVLPNPQVSAIKHGKRWSHVIMNLNDMLAYDSRLAAGREAGGAPEQMPVPQGH